MAFVDPYLSLEAEPDAPTPKAQPAAQGGFIDPYVDQSAEQPSSFLRRSVGDSAISALQGAIDVPTAVVGLADIPTGGLVGKYLERAGFQPRRALEILESYKTPEQQTANRAVSEADGIVGTAKAILQNPSTIPQQVVRALPLTGGGGAVASMLPKGLSALARGAIGEGIVGAGSAAEGTRQESPTGTLTPQQSALSVASGASTAAIGGLSGAASRAVGLSDIDTLLAGGGRANALSIPKRVAGGIVTEGLLEEAPQSAAEQALSNVALNRPVGQGVGQAATTGAFTGGVMGGGANLVSGGVENPSSLQGQQTEQQVETPSTEEIAALDAAATAAEAEGNTETAAILRQLHADAKAAYDAANPPQPTEAQVPGEPAAQQSADGTTPPAEGTPPAQPIPPTTEVPGTTPADGATGSPVGLNLSAVPEVDQAKAEQEGRTATDAQQSDPSKQPAPIFRQDGKPFKTEHAARIAITKHRLADHDVTPVEGGFAIAKRAAAQPTLEGKSAQAVRVDQEKPASQWPAVEGGGIQSGGDLQFQQGDRQEAGDGQAQAPDEVKPSGRRQNIAARKQVAAQPEKAPAISDRRKDTATRRRVDQMSPDDMKRALLTDELTGLQNRRAYDEAPRKARHASIDVDSLKYINDNFGHETGDTLLKEVANALKAAGVEAYRRSGDEFIAQGDDEAALTSALNKARDALASVTLKYTAPDGTVYTYKKPGFSYGIGTDETTAEEVLKSDKTTREAKGTRAARGQEPPGVAARAAAGREANGGEELENKEKTQPDEPLSSVLGRPNEIGQGIEGIRQEPTTLVREDVLRDLRNGHVSIGQFKVRIEQTNDGMRYIAKVEAPGFNTVIDTPRTVNSESMLDFTKRVADRLMSMQHDLTIKGDSFHENEPRRSQQDSEERGASVTEIRGALEQSLGKRFVDTIIGQGWLEIVPTRDDLPKGVQHPDGGERGAYDPKTGKSYLVADALTEKNAAGVMLHEVGVHHGLKGTMKPGKWAALVVQFKHMEAAKNTAAVAARKRAKAAGTTGEIQDEEAIAYFVEAKAANPTGFVGRVKSNVEAKLFEWGLRKKLSDDGFVALARGAASRAGKRPAGQGARQSRDFALEPVTKADLAERDRRVKEAEKKRAEAIARGEAPPPSEFELTGSDLPADVNPRQRSLFSRAEPEDLIIQHNLSPASVLHADRMGGLAVPSMAVTRVGSPLQSFGSITLLGNRDMADPRSGTQVFGGDIYSPRYPEITYRLDAASRKRLAKHLESYQQEGDRNVLAYTTITRLDDLTTLDAFKRYAEKNLSKGYGYDDVQTLAAELLSDVGAEEKLFQGYTYSGSRRYKPHTLDNVVRELKRELRGGEKFNYGAGSVRAKVTPKFRSLADVRSEKGRLVPKANFDKLKGEVNDELVDLASRMAKEAGQGESFSGIDSATQVLQDAASMGVKRALDANGWGGVEEQTRRDMATFLNKLRNLPTEYFEAIRPRAVDMSEFSVAVVPDNTQKRVLDVLRKANLKIVEYKAGDEAARAKAIQDAASDNDLMFSRGNLPPTIKVDGVERPTTDSEGRPIHQTEEGVRNFWRGFAGSTAVDEDGRPIPVYHGSGRKFTVFEPIWKQLDRSLKPSEKAPGGLFHEYYERAKAAPEMYYFTEDEGIAEGYAERSGAPSVMRVFLNVKNPAVDDVRDAGSRDRAIKKMLDENLDGAVFWDTSVSGKASHRGWVIRRSEQAKSATANIGDFDQSNPDINASRGAQKGGGHTVSSARKAIADRLGKKAFDSLSDRFVVVKDAQALREDMQRRGSKFTGMLFSGGVDAGVNGETSEGERLWLRYGEPPEGGKSRHVQHGREENGVSVMIPLDELGRSTWSEQMIFSMTAGEMGGRPLFVVAGKQLPHNPNVYGEGGYGADGEPLISGARVIRMATPMERHLLVRDMEKVAANLGFSRMPNLYKLLNSEKPTDGEGAASRSADDAGSIKGLYDPSTETSYVVAGNLSVQDSPWGVFLHEVGEHYGLERMLGREQHRQVLQNVQQLLRAGVKPVRAAAVRVNAAENMGLDPESPAFAREFSAKMDTKTAREVLAYMVETPANHNMPVMRRIIAAVRAFMRKLGMFKTLNVDDLVALVTAAARKAGGFARTQSASADEMREAIPEGQPLFSRRTTHAAMKGDRFNLPEETLAQTFQRKAQDSTNYIGIVQKAVVDQGGTVDAESDMTLAIKKYPGLLAAKLKTMNETLLEPLMKRIHDAGTTPGEVALLAYAEHAPERNREIAKINKRFPNDGTPGKSGSGMTDADAAEIIRQAALSPNGPKLFALSAQLRKIADKNLDNMVAGGVMAQEQADAYRARYKNYVPLKGFELADEEGAPQGTGKGLSTGSKISMRALGRSSRAGDLFENTLRDYEVGLMLVEKARVARVVRNFVKANPDEKLWSVDKHPLKPYLKGPTYRVFVGDEEVLSTGSKARAEAIATTLRTTDSDVRVEESASVVNRVAEFDPNEEIRFIEDGKAVRITLHPAGMTRAYNGLWNSNVSEGLRLLNNYNGWLRQFYTQKNPAWFVMNVLRDVPSAMIYATGESGASIAAKIPLNIPAAFKAAWALHHNKSAGRTMDAVLKKYMESGGYTGFAYVGDIESQTIRMKGVLARYAGWDEALREFKGGVGKGMSAVGAKILNTRFFAWIEAMNSTFENMTRIAVFKSALDSGLTVDQAGQIAKHASTNFNTRGEWGPNINAAWLFANAGIQGTRNVGHALLFSPHKGQVWTLMGGLVMLGIMAGLMSDDDDDLLDDEFRSRALLFKIGDSQISIPMPYGFGFFSGFGQLLAQVMKHPDKRDQVAMKMASLAFDHFSPFGSPVSGKGDSKDIVNVAPTIAKPILNAAVNVSPWGGAPLYPDSPFDTTKPDSEKMWASTRGTGYAAVAEWINSLTGGDSRRSGLVSVSPETLKLSVNTLFGGAGRMATDLLSLPSSVAAGTTSPKNVPIVKNIYRDVDKDAYVQRFYQQAEEAEDAYRIFRNYQKDRNFDAARAYQHEEKAYVTMGRVVSTYRKRIKALRDKEASIAASDLPNGQKNVLLARTGAEIIRTSKQFNDRLASLR